MEEWFTIQQVYANEPPMQALAIEVGTVASQSVVIDAGTLTAVMVVWVLAIIALTELVKRLWIAAVLKKGKRYRRVVPALPLLVGIGTGGLFGPPAMLAMSFIVTPAFGALAVGPIAGMIAGFVFIIVKRWLVPALIRLAPFAMRGAIIAGAKRLGVDLKPEDLPDVSLDIPREELIEMGLEESTLD